jgi:hypothetical protein
LGKCGTIAVEELTFADPLTLAFQYGPVSRFRGFLPFTRTDAEHRTGNVKAVTDSLEYLKGLGMSASLNVIDYSANTHLTSSADVSTGEAESAALRRDGEYRSKITVSARGLEIWPGQHVRRKIVRRAASRHGFTRFPGWTCAFTGYREVYRSWVLAGSLSPMAEVAQPEVMQHACQANQGEVNQT